MPHVTDIDFFRLLKKRGCKAPDANKALISATVTSAQEVAVEELGYHSFQKHFTFTEVIKWLDDCAERLPEGRGLVKLG